MVCAECVLYCAIFTSKRIQKHETCDQSHAKTREIKTRQDKTRQDETRQDQTDIYGHLRIINYEPGGHTAEKIIIGPADVFRT